MYFVGSLCQIASREPTNANPGPRCGIAQKTSHEPGEHVPKVPLYDLGLSLEIPPDWEDRTVYTFLAPPDSFAGNLPTLNPTAEFRPNLVVTRQPVDSTRGVKLLAAEQLRTAETQLAGVEVVDESELTINGQTVIAHHYEFTAPPDNARVSVLQAYVLIGDTLHGFTFTTLPHARARHAPMFDRILRSLVVEPRGDGLFP